MPLSPPHLIAGGDIRPCRFVKISGEMTALECDANDKVIGISQEGATQPPLSDLSITELAGSSGKSMELHSAGDVCLLVIGSGGVTAGDRLKSDADGKGVAILLTGTVRQEWGAIALETNVENEKCRVFVDLGVMLPAVA